MRNIKIVLTALVLAAAGSTAAHSATAVADSHRPAADVARDAARKPAAMLDFAGITHGSKVADFIPGGGYFTRLFAVAVKPGGSVVAIIPAEAAKVDPTGAAAVGAIAADQAYGDVNVVSSVSDPSASGLDVFWTAQNYHDLHNSLPPEAMAGFNKAVFAALKPGGVYVIVDHAAVAGSGVAATKTLHRIDPAAVKTEVTAAGFVFDGESDVLRNPGRSAHRDRVRSGDPWPYRPVRLSLQETEVRLAGFAAIRAISSGAGSRSRMIAAAAATAAGSYGGGGATAVSVAAPALAQRGPKLATAKYSSLASATSTDDAIIAS